METIDAKLVLNLIKKTTVLDLILIHLAARRMDENYGGIVGDVDTTQAANLFEGMADLLPESRWLEKAKDTLLGWALAYKIYGTFSNFDTIVEEILDDLEYVKQDIEADVCSQDETKPENQVSDDSQD
jgi:hypothetical protein